MTSSIWPVAMILLGFAGPPGQASPAQAGTAPRPAISESGARAGDRWELAGRTVDDNEIVLDIDARDGRILD